ncbi:MAG: glycosyltransferase family 2 protein [Nitriliruptorales bacterium]
MRVTAIVVNWNGAHHLERSLGSLLAQDHGDLDILVVDNASSDASADVLGRLMDGPGRPRLRVHWNRRNRGYAGGVNDGLGLTDAPAVLVANPDVRLEPGYVRNALDALVAEPRRGAVQGRLLRPRPDALGRRIVDTTGHVAFRTRLFHNRGEGLPDDGRWERPGEVFGVSGALALYRREMLDDVAVDGEVLDERLFAYWEDVDLDWRAALRGWDAWYEPRAVAEHERGGSGPRRTPRVEQLSFQNRLLMLVKCDAPRSLVRDLPGFVTTTTLKAAELALTAPTALVRSLGATGLLPAMLGKRRVIQARATVPTEEVVERWFQPFDYPSWVWTWWRRSRAT